MADRRRDKLNRRGSVYLAVLGTGLIVSLLALSALALQRLQNRMLSASADVRQAQLNAESAIELGMLAIKQDSNWRTTYANGTWFSNRSTGDGACTLEVADPVDADLSDNATDPIVMTGIGTSGTSGTAVQRVVRTFDSNVESLDCLRSSVAAGGNISITGAVLRATDSGLISANSTSATSSTIDGQVQAMTVTGSTYSGTTQQVAAADRPTMPDWSTAFDYYRTNGTEININSLPSSTPNLGRNVGIEIGPSSPVTDWTGSPPGIATATIAQSTTQHYSGSISLRVQRATWQAGAAQRIDDFVKRGQQYYVETRLLLPTLLSTKNFRIALYTKGTGDSSPQIAYEDTSVTNVLSLIWAKPTATITAGNWSGNLEYAFVKVAGDSDNDSDFYLDDFYIRETTSGRFIYRQVLGPGVDTIDSTRLNSQGIYWINCNGNKLVIERSRIKGTLLVVNPGAGSCITGPIRWSPAVTGYPSLLVDADSAANADFTIGATNQSLGETENSVNYNPSGASSDDFGQDTDLLDIYPSEMQGLVVVEDDLTFQNNALVRGQVITGGDVTATSGALEVVYRPDALFSPPPGFTAPSSVVGRPVSIRKAVLP